MTFTLVEREKLGPNAYRVNATAPLFDAGKFPLDREAAWDEMRREIAVYPERYAPTGGFTLVLLSDGGQRR